MKIIFCKNFNLTSCQGVSKGSIWQSGQGKRQGEKEGRDKHLTGKNGKLLWFMQGDLLEVKINFAN